MRITPVHLIAAGDMSADVSAIQQLNQIYAYSVEAVYAGSPNGALSLQASNDYDPDTGSGTWTTIADSSNTITGAGSTMWNVTSSNYAYLKVVFTFSSGTGTLNAYFYGRGF